MLTIKETLEKIKEQFSDLFGSDITDIRLEEIEPSSKDEYFLTVSFLIPNKNIPGNITSILGSISNPYIRQYKTVVASKLDGSIVKIKIHKDA